MPLFWGAWKVPRLWKLNVRRSTQKMNRSNVPPRKLKKSNQKGTMEISGSRWGVLTSVTDV